jgi:ABC-type transporter Mla maintaining outer membrane lipid asymmetry ATPase subunit MlaF
MRGVFQHVKGRCVISDFHLRLRQGECLVLLGANGAGKTLLMRLVLGLDLPSAGEIRVFGQDLARLEQSELDALRTRIGAVFQGGSLLNGLNVLENLLLPLRRSALTCEGMARRARLIMTLLRLDGLENLRPFELSSGMRCSVELARALIRNPSLLLWDELGEGLDRAAYREIRQHLAREKKIRDMALIVSSHQPDTALTLADQVAVIDGGRLLFQGTPAELEQTRGQDPALAHVLEGRP